MQLHYVDIYVDKININIHTQYTHTSYFVQAWHCTVGQTPKGMVFFWNWPLSGLQGVEVCAGLLQSVPRSAAECVQGYRGCAECSFNILPFSSRLNQKIFD